MVSCHVLFAEDCDYKFLHYKDHVLNDVMKGPQVIGPFLSEKGILGILKIVKHVGVRIVQSEKRIVIPRWNIVAERL